ncbi:hypothetical protein NC652_021656 [Populus alba x Populus x berolinensis]|nr:hypothetical protein NC652_021656 [Populus alba x Populus x berolinensis]
MLLLLATAAPSPASPSWCSDELVAFSPCLGTARQSQTLQPLIFGFPLNESRVIALPYVCSLSSPVSLDLLCSGSPALPPFAAQQLQRHQSPDDLSLAPSLPPESVDRSPRSPVSPLPPASDSPAEKHNSNS